MSDLQTFARIAIDTRASRYTGTIAEIVDAAIVSGLDGDLVDSDGRFAGRILSTPGLVPLILLTDSP